MMPPSSSDRYIATKILPRIPFTMDRLRSVAIEEEQRLRCLTPVGHSIFMQAVRCYLARRRAEGDELVAKAAAFLHLAHATGEKQRHDYGRGYSEGVRSAELSYIHWLSTGNVDETLLEDARTNLGIHYMRRRNLDRKVAALASPRLLYTEAYPLIRKMAELLSIAIDPESGRKVTGLFGQTLRIASADDEAQRRVEKERLRKRIPRQLFTWIDKGHYDSVAYALHALFPRPEGPPCQLIEECWNYIS